MGTEGSGNRLTSVYSYYNAPENLRCQLDLWGRYPRKLRRRLRFVLVDDASREPLELPNPPALNLALYRIEEDVGWNNGGARNLGAYVAEDGWLFLSDIDHQVPAETCRRMLEFTAEADPGCYYTFRRFCRGRRLPWPPNLFLVHRETFSKLGGYDENLSGHYGGEDVLIRALLDRSCRHVEKPWEIEVEESTSYARPSDEPDRGKLQRNDRLVREKLAAPDYRPQRPLRFGWHKVAEFRADEKQDGPRRGRPLKARVAAQQYRGQRLALRGEHGAARRLYESLPRDTGEPRVRGLVQNDLAVLAVLEGNLSEAARGDHLRQQGPTRHHGGLLPAGPLPTRRSRALPARRAGADPPPGV